MLELLVHRLFMIEKKLSIVALENLSIIWTDS